MLKFCNFLKLFLIHFSITGDLHYFSFLRAFLTSPAFQGGTLGALSSVEDVAVTAAHIPGRTVESGGQRENCNQRDLTFHRWDLQQVALALQPLPHLHNSPARASSWLNHSWTNCFTPHVPNSGLCTMLTVEVILTGPMPSLIAVTLGCVWFVREQLQLQVSPDLAVKADMAEISWHCPTFQDSSA